MVKWIVGIIVVAIAAGGVWYYKGRAGSGPQYQTAPLARGELIQAVTASGQLEPVVNVAVGSQVSGRIKNLYVDFNSVVKSNQLIAEIDPSPFQIAVLKAEADVANSKAALELSQVEADRSEALFTNKLVSASDHDTAIAQLHQAEAQLQSSEANLSNAKVQLSYCTIYAPVDGVVISRAVEAGQTVASSFNTPTLFQLAGDLTSMEIDALVSEADIGGVAVGQRVDFNVDAFPYRTFQGVISQVRYGPVTNQSVVNYAAVVAVNNSDLKLLPGMTANVSIITAERPDTLKIPNAALRFHPIESSVATNKMVVARQAGDESSRTNDLAGSGTRRADRGRGGGGGGGRRQNGGGKGGDSGGVSTRTVYILDRTKNPDHPELKPVKIKIGITDGVNTEVVEGLNEGDEVVVSAVADVSSSSASNPFGGGGFGGPRRF